MPPTLFSKSDTNKVYKGNT